MADKRLITPRSPMQTIQLSHPFFATLLAKITLRKLSNIGDKTNRYKHTREQFPQRIANLTPSRWLRSSCRIKHSWQTSVVADLPRHCGNLNQYDGSRPTDAQAPKCHSTLSSPASVNLALRDVTESYFRYRGAIYPDTFRRCVLHQSICSA